MHTNNLINETSIYLLQHAHNPVNWYAWNDEALQKAKSQKKPILVSIGYAACHWCHVMEKESFEDETVAAYMNEHFINIKVDREERPDLDHIFMDAVQAISGSGGWPLNVFLTPEGKPFYGGTYFPPVKAFNRISWKELLKAIHELFEDKREEIELNADNIISHLSASSTLLEKMNDETSNFFNTGVLKEIARNMLKNADAIWGGFGKAPKFPQTFCIQYLLRQFYFTRDDTAFNQAILSLDKMMQGGIYDHLGGGFSRYSTDEKWQIPHFEKMLYDNALLLMAYSEAFQLTKDKKYALVISQTVEFLKRELLAPRGGFYCALDADSEGIEGKYYVWNKKEIDKILAEEAELFCSIYNVSENGNWEHANILWQTKSLEDWSKELNMDIIFLEKKLLACRKKLLDVREKRIHPVTDDKILLGWNALTIVALCSAYAALTNEEYLHLAEENICFLEKNFITNSGEWQHSFKNGASKTPAFLDDYAFLIKAYIQLQEVTGNEDYLIKAKDLTGFVIINFAEEASGYFYFTAASQKDVLIRRKDLFDSATPSGNSVMAQNLFYLSYVFEHAAWKKHAENITLQLAKSIIKYPISFGWWALNMQLMTEEENEIAIIGSSASQTLKDVLKEYIPNKIIQSSIKQNDYFALLKNRWSNNKTDIYLCRNKKCLQPVTQLNDLLRIVQPQFVYRSFL